MASNYPPPTTAPIIINSSTAKPDGVVIFLHGLGDTGQGWSAGFESIRQPNVKYIFPTAPTQPVSLNFGMPMPSWFDIMGLSPNDKEDEQGIKNAAAHLLSMVEAEEKAGIPSNKIVLGGFSQGGAVALYAALSTQKQLGGVIALSCWLPLHKGFAASGTNNKEMAILQCHGDSDPMVNVNFGRLTGKLLKDKGHKQFEFKEYSGMQHGSCDKEMNDVKHFIGRIFPSQ